MRRSSTFGVDLAAQPKKTAVCTIEWFEDGRGQVGCLGLGATDDDILRRMARGDVSVTAIDAPFGWPAVFINALRDYAAHGSWPDTPGIQLEQEAMRLRATDRAVHQETKLTPLSVSTHRIGVVAMRCARLLAAHWQATCQPPDRSGEGGVIEVYPRSRPFPRRRLSPRLLPPAAVRSVQDRVDDVPHVRLSVAGLDS